MLHEKEEWGQSALGRIGIWRGALALALIAGFEARAAQQAMLLESGGDPTGETREVEARLVTVQNYVGVVDVRARQLGNSCLQLREAVENLRVC